MKVHFEINISTFQRLCVCVTAKTIVEMDITTKTIKNEFINNGVLN